MCWVAAAEDSTAPGTRNVLSDNGTSLARIRSLKRKKNQLVIIALQECLEIQHSDCTQSCEKLLLPYPSCGRELGN